MSSLRLERALKGKEKKGEGDTWRITGINLSKSATNFDPEKDQADV